MMKIALLAFVMGSAWSAATAQEMSLPATPQEVHPPLIGYTLPDLYVENLDGQPVNLADMAREQPTILVFYRGSWCPFCNLQLAQLQEVWPSLQEMGYQLLAVSTDEPEAMAGTIDRHDLTYTVLSDANRSAMIKLGIAWGSSDATHGILPVPTVMILNEQAQIEFIYVNPDHRVRLSGEILEVAARVSLES